jgi:hypothetical protein
MNSPLFRRIASAVVAILLFIYIGYQIYNSNHEPVQIETAIYTNAGDTIQVNGTAIRKEKLINSNSNGVITYLINDGGKVAKGGKVAQIHANPQDANSQQQLENLNRQIVKLEKLNSPGNTYAASPDSINKQINIKLIELNESINSNNYIEVSKIREDLLYLINERQIVTNKAENFNSRVSLLKSQYNTISAKNSAPIGYVTAPSSGFFISSTDGYEHVYDYSKIPTLLPDEFKNMQKASPQISNSAIGKISENFDWYFAFIVPQNQSNKFKLGNRVNIQFPFASSEIIPATIEAVNQKDNKSEALVVLKSDYMNSSLADIRNQTAKVQLESYEGIQVSQDAVHFETIEKTVKNKDGKTSNIKKEVQGVYVMRGSEMQFRQIIPLFSTENYVICDSNPSKENLMTDSTVKLFDEVVIGGTDLYHGKVVR